MHLSVIFLYCYFLMLFFETFFRPRNFVLTEWGCLRKALINCEFLDKFHCLESRNIKNRFDPQNWREKLELEKVKNQLRRKKIVAAVHFCKFYHTTMRTLHSLQSTKKATFCNIFPGADGIVYARFDDVRTFLYVFILRRCSSSVR